jgi:putative ABC transport system substrate-binding protein
MRKPYCHIALCVVFIALCDSAQAQQQPKIPRLGYVSTTGNPNNPGPNVETFKRALRDFGYVEGNNIATEYRYIEGKMDRVADLVAELLQLKIDVLVVNGLTPVRIAKQATTRVPIVMVTTQDPIATGLVNSLARPGGNLTGLTSLVRDLSGKRLELLKEVAPNTSRVAVLWNAEEEGAAIALKEYEAAARVLKVDLQSLGIRAPTPDLEGAFQAGAKGRANALVTITGSLLSSNAKPIADLAAKNVLPSIYESYRYVQVGGLMSYAASEAEGYRRAAVYVDKILKGAKPADLPIEQPTKFELVINLKTAKHIGLTIPPNVLARADRVIR